MSSRFTRKEEEALRAACGFVLAGEASETLDGDEELVDALESAQQKLWERERNRQPRRPR